MNVSPPLVQRVTRAQQRLATASGALPDDGSPEELTDTPNYLDPSRLVIPLARPTVAYRLYRSGHRHSHATITATKVFLATTLAAVAGIALGTGPTGLGDRLRPADVAVGPRPCPRHDPGYPPHGRFGGRHRLVRHPAPAEGGGLLAAAGVGGLPVLRGVLRGAQLRFLRHLHHPAGTVDGRLPEQPAERGGGRPYRRGAALHPLRPGRALALASPQRTPASCMAGSPAASKPWGQSSVHC